MNEYKAKCVKVYDADSATFEVDLGFYITHEIKTRFWGIDTPEIKTKNEQEKAWGKEARDFVRSLILRKEIIIQTFLNTKKQNKKGKFGRYLAVVKLEDGTNLNELLVSKGYAKEYDGKGKREKWFQ
jgi:micrococcal nuclease